MFVYGRSRTIFFPSNTLIYGISRDGTPAPHRFTRTYRTTSTQTQEFAWFQKFEKPNTHASADDIGGWTIYKEAQLQIDMAAEKPADGTKKHTQNQTSTIVHKFIKQTHKPIAPAQNCQEIHKPEL